MSYRHAYGTELRSVHLGHERPYLSPSHSAPANELPPAPPVPRLPVSIPPLVMEQIQQQVEQSHRRMQVTAIVLEANQQYMDQDSDMEYEATMERDAYRQGRQSDTS